MKPAAILAKLESSPLGRDRAFLTFSRKSKGAVAARELEAAGKVKICDWFGNEIRVSLK